MPITQQRLARSSRTPALKRAFFVSVLNTAMQHYQIVGTKRATAFIAQIGHESGQLCYVREIWGPTAAQRGY